MSRASLPGERQASDNVTPVRQRQHGERQRDTQNWAALYSQGLPAWDDNPASLNITVPYQLGADSSAVVQGAQVRHRTVLHQPVPRWTTTPTPKPTSVSAGARRLSALLHVDSHGFFTLSVSVTADRRTISADNHEVVPLDATQAGAAKFQLSAPCPKRPSAGLAVMQTLHATQPAVMLCMANAASLRRMAPAVPASLTPGRPLKRQACWHEWRQPQLELVAVKEKTNLQL